MGGFVCYMCVRVGMVTVVIVKILHIVSFH